ncbi:MAG TPA: beta-galactosidase [Clostridiaceae bacterium]
MKSINWDSKSYKIDGQPEFLVSGEFHYFRVPKKEWEVRLNLFKEAGGNCVATYVPWILHEPSEGDFRLGDIPERDLEGFLDLCKKLEIFVICRPGPYQYSEMKYDGLPQWLIKNYKEILANDIKGNILRHSSISYLHPKFLEKARLWYEKICPIISKWTLSKGGPVAFIQFDNELGGIHEWFGGLDYNKEAMGLGDENGRFPLFLREKYKETSLLNISYGTDFNSFKDAYPISSEDIKNDFDRLRVKDYQEFYFTVIASYAEILVNWFKEFNIDCNIVHNSANPTMNSYFLETIDKLKGGFLLGSDHYYNLDMNWDQNNPTPLYAEKVFYSNEMLRLMGFPATVFELPGGSPSDWPPITHEDLKCCYMTNVALGMKGLNYYIFTGGPNPLNIGSNGDSYDYNASIGENGDIRDNYNVQKEFGEFLKENSWMARSYKVSDFYVGLNFEYSRSGRYTNNSSIDSFSNEEAWILMNKGIIISSLCGSYSPNLVNLYDESYDEFLDKPLVITSSNYMAKEIQMKLVSFIKNGGRVIICPVIPCYDENFKSCTILKDFLQRATCNKFHTNDLRINLREIKNIHVSSAFYSTKSPEGAEAIGIEENSGRIVAWEKCYDRGGSITWLGLNWNHDKNSQIDMLTSILKIDKPIVLCDNHNLWTSLRTNQENSILFIMNLFSSSLTGKIKVLGSDGNYINLGKYTLKPMEVKTINL